MNVILDTNILRQDFSLKSSKFDALFSYLEKTDSKLVLPEVILREATNLFRRELQSQLSKFKSVSEKLTRMTFTTSPPVTVSLDIDSEVEEYRKLLLKPREAAVIVPLVPNHLSETINRLIEGKKPASVGGNEFRDVVIWLSIIEYLTKNKSDTVVFISANTKEFADDAGAQLALELQHELTSHGLNLVFQTSIENFLKEHASKIDFITHEWLEANISEDEVYKLAMRSLESRSHRFEKYVQRKVDDFSGELVVTNINPSLSSFFLYDMQSGEVYLNLTYYGEVEIEVTLDAYDPDPDAGWYSTRTSLFDRQESTKLLYPEVYLYFSARVINGKVADLELDDWEMA